MTNVEKLEATIRTLFAGRLAERRMLFEWTVCHQDSGRAHHEAAHALVAALCGLCPHEIVLRDRTAEPDFRGLVSLGYCQLGPPSEAVEQGPIVLDRESIGRLARSHVVAFGWQATLRWLRRLRGETDELLKHHWPAVRALAEALIRERRLDRAQIYELLARYSISGALDSPSAAFAVAASGSCGPAKS